MRNKIWVFDIETDSLKPTKIHCISVSNIKNEKVFSTSNYDEMRKVLTQADVLIAHNCIRFDIPVCEKLLGIKIKARIVDTLALSWYLYPTRVKHGLEEYGIEFGVPKPKIDDWFNLSVEEYIHRCEEDVKINTKLWKKQLQYLLNIYGSKEKVWRFLDYMQKKMHCTRLQEESKWKLDTAFVLEALRELEAIKEEKFLALQKAMPLVPIVTYRNKPKRYINADGSFSKKAQDWIALLSEKGLPPDHTEPVEIIKGFDAGNPNSTDQLKDWLNSFGWKPQTFKYVKDKETGETRAIPQINQEHGKGICPSIVALYDKEPDLEYIDGLGVVSHRISILKGFLEDVDENGFVSARVAGLTNTLRFKHAELVNLPKVEKAYGKFIRGALIARDGKVLCGSDQSSLEDRIKQHFIYPLDPDYVDSMNEKGFDPHLIIAVIAGMCSQEDADNYKWVATLSDAEKAVADKVLLDWAKRIKPTRDIAKNGNYASSKIRAYKIV